MTKDEALEMCLEYIVTNSLERRHVRWAIKEALAQPEERQWVGLTDEERLKVLQFIDPKAVRFPLGFKQIAESIERLLKEKNA